MQRRTFVYSGIEHYTEFYEVGFDKHFGRLKKLSSSQRIVQKV